MALALNVKGIDDGGDLVYIFGTLTPSGSYSSGGDTLDLTTIEGAAVLARVFAAATVPVNGSVYGTTGDSYGFIPGAALNNGKVKINTASNTELGAGAYPARITGDANINFEFVFQKLQ